MRPAGWIRLFRPLDLRQTWLCADPTDSRPVSLRYRAAPLVSPGSMAILEGDDGLVTTTWEGLVLLRALWSGPFGPVDWLTRLPFRPVFFPETYGEGVLRLALSRWLTGFWPFTAIPATVNQEDRLGTVFRLMLKALQSAGRVHTARSIFVDR